MRKFVVSFFVPVLFLVWLIKGIRRKCSRIFWLYHALAYCKWHGVKLPISGRIYFYGKPYLRFDKNSSVEFGDNFVCNSGINYAIDNFTCVKICVKHDAKLKIGCHSGLTNTVIHCHQSITIGDYVNIGAGCMIFDTNFHSTDWKIRKDSKKDGENARVAPIIIKDNAFIGARSIIMKGVTIGEKSILSAGSVVSQNVPDGEIWGGNPARFIKSID